MRRRTVLPMLVGLVFSVTVGASDAKAFVFRQLRSHRSASYRRVSRGLQRHPVTGTSSAYPTTTWELGNHLGDWPPYHRH